MKLGYQSYQHGSQRGGKRFEIPLTVKHSWVPIAFILYCIYHNQNFAALSIAETCAGLMIAFLSVLPLFIWAAQPMREPPAFQCFCAIHFPYFAYPILVTKPLYMAFSELTRLTAAGSVIAYLTAAIIAYYARSNIGSPSRLAELIPYRVIPAKTMERIGVLCMIVWFLHTVFFHFGYYDHIYNAVRGSRNIFTSIGFGSAFLGNWTVWRQWGEGRLTAGQKLFVGTIFILSLTIMFSATLLIYGMIILVVCCVAYTQGRNRVPWLLIAMTIGLLSFLNLGKSEARAYYRSGSPAVNFDRIIDIYERWFIASMRVIDNPELRIRDNRDVLSRANLIQVHAQIVDQTPAVKPFLYGKTYLYIPQLLVPRMLWPNKPHIHIATDTIGVMYGVAANQSVKSGTTIGIGPISEAWANFGWGGVILGGLTIGFVMRVVGRACIGANERSLHMLASVVWVANSFQVEMPASGWLASFETQLAVLLICLYPMSRPATRPSLVRQPMIATA
jgi:hypothetical protein